MRVLIQFLNKLFLAVLSFAVLSVGAFLIFIERKTSAAEEYVKTWKSTTCKVLEIKAGPDENFYCQCQYIVDGKTYQVKNQTPSWNPYFNSVGSSDGKVVVTLRDSNRQSHFYEFKQGQDVPAWYEPSDPSNSVLIPYAASLRPFLYIGMGYYIFLAVMIFLEWKRKTKLQVEP